MILDAFKNISTVMLWTILLLLQTVLVQSRLLPLISFNDNALFPSSDWDRTIGEIISTLERSTVNDSSVLSNLFPLFFATSTDTTSFPSKPKRPWFFQQVSDRSQRLIDSTSPDFTSLMVDALDLLENLRTYRTYEFQIHLMVSPTAIAVSAMKYQGIALDSLLSSCEVLYAKLLKSQDFNQIFVLAVPLAFMHLSALREKSSTSDTSQQYEASRNLTVWLATYWQFVSDGYLRWKEWRISQLQVDRWVHRTLIQNICHAILWDKLFKRHLLNLQMEDCNDPVQLDAHITSVLAQSSNQLEFDMMAIVSKIFILHKFIPGFEMVGPFPGNFSTTLQLGPIQPLTYQTLWNKTHLSDSSIFDGTCQPSPSSVHLKGITSVAVQQWSWVEDIRVQYENGADRFQGTPAGGRVESMSFNPNSEQCLASITWRLNTSSHMAISVAFASRNGESVGSVWNPRIAGDVTMYTTASLLYCITNVATCTATPNSTSAVTSFQVSFDLQNITREMPLPLFNGLTLIKRNPAFVVTQNGSRNESTRSFAVNRFMDAPGVSLPQSVLRKYANSTPGQTNGKESSNSAAATTKTPVTRKNTSVPVGRNATDQGLNGSFDMVDFKLSNEQYQPASATTQPALPIKTNFLFVLRRLKPEEQAEFIAFMAAAWAEANNHSVHEVHVNVTKVAPAISDTGKLSSNITYTVSGPAPLEDPSHVQDYNSSVSRFFARGNWTILECHWLYSDYDCFSANGTMFPAYRLFVTAFNNTNVDPTRIRNKIRKAVQMANLDLQGTRLEVGFPAHTPPQQTELVTKDGERLLEINYFIAATNQSADIKTPSPEQVQTQFSDSTVYADGDPRLRQPVTIVIQRRDNTGNQINFGKLLEEEKAVIKQEMEEIADQAVRNVAARLNMSCLDCTGHLLDIADLYGLFGRHLFKTIILPKNTGTSYPDSLFLTELTKELVKVINSSSQSLTVASELEYNITVTDPNRVYFKDFFRIPSSLSSYYNREILEPFYSLNAFVEMEVMVLATESRQAADGSNFTRVYYTITSKSPYTRYPLPKDINSYGYNRSTISTRLACATPRCLFSTKKFCGWWNESIRDKSNDVSSWSSCYSWEFRCGSGKCISARYKCDRDRDCDDGSDEEGCSIGNSTTLPPVAHSCASTEFRCNDGRCIPLAWTCDGDSDCADGSDESDFCGAVPCQYIQCTCTSRLCTAIVTRCDSYADCSGSSNSTICSSETTTCKPQEFKCGNGHGCVKQVYRCDGYPDCPDGSDESSCMS